MTVVYPVVDKLKNLYVNTFLIITCDTYCAEDGIFQQDI